MAKWNSLFFSYIAVMCLILALLDQESGHLDPAVVPQAVLDVPAGAQAFNATRYAEPGERLKYPICSSRWVDGELDVLDMVRASSSSSSHVRASSGVIRGPGLRGRNRATGGEATGAPRETLTFVVSRVLKLILSSGRIVRVICVCVHFTCYL
jgi:hypothetical protein